MTKLVPFNIDEYRKIPFANISERRIARKRYLNWLSEQRYIDKKNLLSLKSKINNWKYRRYFPDKVKETNKKYYEKMKMNRIKVKKIFQQFICKSSNENQIHLSVKVFSNGEIDCNFTK